jgi:hypothetical protein
MAISRIRGDQIRDKSILNQHVADDAAIAETKLAIDWTGHYQSALQTKKIVDFVQANKIDVAGVSEFDLSPLIPNTVPNVQSDPLSGEGVIIDAPKNAAPIRDSVTGDPILDANHNEVIARVTFDATGNKFVLKFLSVDPNTSAETAFVMPAGQKVDMQYAKRFNLQSVSENFAANEKFVEGTADASAHLNINQIALDLYGASFSLDRDGNANLSKSLVQQMSDEVDARIAADQTIRDDLSSTLAGKGSSLVGVQDAAGNFTATNLEDVLTEIDGRLKTLAGGGSTTQDEVDAARKSSITGTEVTHASLDERLESDATILKQQISDEATRAQNAEQAIHTDLASTATGKGASLVGVEDAAGKFTATTVEGVLTEIQGNVEAEKTRAEAAESALSDRAGALETEVQLARGTAASLDVRLDRALNEDGTLKAGVDIHKHHKAHFQAVGGESVVQLSAFNVANLPAYQVGDNTLDVYINGMLQNEGLHYAEVAGGQSIDFSMGDGTTLVSGDIVTIKYQINHAE